MRRLCADGDRDASELMLEARRDVAKQVMVSLGIVGVGYRGGIVLRRSGGREGGRGGGREDEKRRRL